MKEPSVKYHRTIWNVRKLCKYSNGKSIAWARDRMMRVLNGELRMFDVLKEAKLKGNTQLKQNESTFYSKHKNKLFTIKTIQDHLQKEYGHTITVNRAWERIQKARLDPETYEPKLLLPNHQMARIERSNKAAEIPENAQELKKREEKFLALNNPEDAEMWAIQERILSQY